MYIHICMYDMYIYFCRSVCLAFVPQSVREIEESVGADCPLGRFVLPCLPVALVLTLKKKKVHNMQSIFYKYFGSLIFCKHLSSLYFYFDTLKSFLYIFLFIITMLGVFILFFY